MLPMSQGNTIDEHGHSCPSVNSTQSSCFSGRRVQCVSASAAGPSGLGWWVAFERAISSGSKEADLALAVGRCRSTEATWVGLRAGAGSGHDPDLDERPKTRGVDAQKRPLPTPPLADAGARVASDLSAGLDHPWTRAARAPSIYSIEAATPEVWMALAARAASFSGEALTWSRNLVYPTSPMMSGRDVRTWQERMANISLLAKVDGLYSPGRKTPALRSSRATVWLSTGSSDQNMGRDLHVTAGLHA